MHARIKSHIKMKERVKLGRDGLYALFYNSFGESEEGVRDNFSKYGEVARVKLVGVNCVFVSFYKEADAQRCLEDNPYMKVPQNKEKKADQNGISVTASKTRIDNYNWREPSTNGFISHHEVKTKVVTYSAVVPEAAERFMLLPWEARKASLQAETHSSQKNHSEPNLASPREAQKELKNKAQITMPWGDHKGGAQVTSIKTDKVAKSALVVSSEQKQCKTPPPTKPLVVAATCSSDVNSVESSPPPLVKRCPVNAQRMVEMIIANFPIDFNEDTILELTYELKPTSIGPIKWTSTTPKMPYVHILLSETAANILESWNHLLFRNQRLIVAPAHTLIEEGSV